MKRESAGIVGACALGALIGTLAALEIASRFKYGSYFWGIGAALGGIIAYVAVDFRQLVTSVVRAYRATRNRFAQKSRFYWRVVAFGSAALILFWISWVVAAVVMILLENGLAFSALFFAMFSLFTNPWTIDGAQIRGDSPFGERRRCVKRYHLSVGLLVFSNPIVLPITLIAGVIWMLPRALKQSKRAALWLGSSTVSAVKAIGWFVKYTFIYVHSQRRTICFVDATLGAAVGYSFGSAIVGAVAGSLLGLVNYELVSVRWLRLSPVPTPAETPRV